MTRNAATRMEITTLWVWRANEEGPELAQTWMPWEWPEGDPDAIDKLVGEAVANWSPLSAYGYRLLDILIDYSSVEGVFYDIPQVEGEIA